MLVQLLIPHLLFTYIFCTNKQQLRICSSTFVSLNCNRYAITNKLCCYMHTHLHLCWCMWLPYIFFLCFCKGSSNKNASHSGSGGLVYHGLVHLHVFVSLNLSYKSCLALYGILTSKINKSCNRSSHNGSCQATTFHNVQIHLNFIK